MKGITKQFESLSFNEILAIKSNHYDDYDLLDVLEYFNEQDDERANAVIELILRSSDYDEMVDYSNLYSELIEYYHFVENYPATLRWTYAWLVSNEQHESGANRADCINQLAEAYLCNNDLSTGISMFVRRIRQSPTAPQTYYAFAFALWLCDLNDLALETAHRGLAIASETGDQELKETLEQLGQDINEETIEAEFIQEIDPVLVAEMRAAFCLDANHATQETEPYLPPISRLLDPNAIHDPTLRADILLQMRVLAPELIRLAFDENLPSGPVTDQVIALLREMQPDLHDEFTEILPWLNRADGDWQKQLLLPRFGKVGGYSTPELRKFGLNSEYAQNIRVSAIEALKERLDNCPEQRLEVVEILREMLTRPELDSASEEFLNGVVIDVILEIDARELYPEIKAAFEQDCVDPTMISLNEVHVEWKMPLAIETQAEKYGLNLLLECRACGRIRQHFTRYVLVEMGTLDEESEDRETRYTSFILDHEIICPKCGAHDQYELTAQSQMMLLAPRDPELLVEFLKGEKPSKPVNADPRLFYFKSAALGREMHPFEAVEEYRWRIINKPGDARLHAGFGKLLRLLGRPSQALEEFQFAYELEPRDSDTLINLAMAEHDFGDRARARELYKELILLEVQEIDLLDLIADNKPDDEIISFSYAAREGLDSLQRGGPSPWFVDIHNSQGQSLVDFINKKVQDSGITRSQKRRKSRKGK
jgi:tetratricopeptide (TPR) repeat protein